MTQSTRQSIKPGTKTVLKHIWWCGDCIVIEIGQGNKAPVCRCKSNMTIIGKCEESIQEHTKGTN